MALSNEYVLLEPVPGLADKVNTGSFTYFQTVYSWVLTLTVALAFIMIVIGGVQYAASFAAPSAKDDAKKRITGAITGLVLAMCSYLILRTIDPVLVNPPSTFISAGTGGSGGGGGGTKCTGTNCLTEDAARALLDKYHIGTKPVCKVGQSVDCVTLDGIRQQTLDEAIWMKEHCGCDIFITGGTEDGHSSGHTNGYKLDIRPNSGLDNWVQDNMTHVGKLSGYEVYENNKVPGSSGSGWMRESDHWDVDRRGPQTGLI